MSPAWRLGKAWLGTGGAFWWGTDMTSSGYGIVLFCFWWGVWIGLHGCSQPLSAAISLLQDQQEVAAYITNFFCN